MNEPVLVCENLSKTYQDETQPVHVLKAVNFSINSGDKIAIVGPSGSGKSTLLHLLGGLDRPSSGQVQVLGNNWQKLSEKKRCKLRNKTLGFVYQFHHLLPEFNAWENVAMPLMLSGMSIRDSKYYADEILDSVGLSERSLHKPAQLSGGERQRVAIARALVHKPTCVLADEPTGNLDQETATKVFDLMVELNSRLKTSLVIVTHDKALSEKMDRVLVLQSGLLVESV